MARNLGLLILIVAAFAGCRSKQEAKVPELDDTPRLQAVTRSNLANIAPAYGIAVGSGAFQVSLEPADSRSVKVGQKAWVALSPDDPKPIPAQVTSVNRASSEADQAIAWLKPLSGSHIPAGEFVFAKVVTGEARGVLAIPRSSIYIKDGFPLVLKHTQGKDGKASLTPTEVELGIELGDLTEVKTGLSEGDQVAVEGGIGYLFPTFKDSDDD